MKGKYTIIISTIVTLIAVFILSSYYEDLEKNSLQTNIDNSKTPIVNTIQQLPINPTLKETPPKENIMTIQAAQKIEETTYQSVIEPISKSTLVSTVNGTIYDNGKSYGEIVKKGTPIIRINSTEAKDELMTQVVNYITTKDTYRSNKFSVQKNIELEKKGIISKREVEESESRFMKSLITMVKERVKFKSLAESLNFDWKKIENLNLDDQPFFEKNEAEEIIEILLNRDYIVNIIAKDSGRFLPKMDNNNPESINTTKGNHIKKQQIIGIIADPNEIQSTVNIPEFDVTKFQIGQPARITVPALNSKELSGEVVNIKKFEYKAQSGQDPKIPVVVQAQCDQDCIYLYGLSVNITILNNPKNSIQIPMNAVKREQDQDYVMMIKDNQYIKTPVTVGPTTNNSITITKGLEEGDQIVKNYPNEQNK
ncbi:MAG: HlyD family efflux transporter periplasmic adaptor subunit [Pseudomonadota bacterium]|nr:HlyD family efflux transporter periplasmic adaptor subunit [Pseudomonadota bacterium]